MFDGRLRGRVEERLRPVGANLRRTGITADHLTLLGVRHGVRRARSPSASARSRVGCVLLVLAAVPDVLDGAVAKASGTAPARGRVLRLGDRPGHRRPAARRRRLVPRVAPTPAACAVLPFAVLAASMLISYERAKAESLGFDAKGGLMERAERIIAARASACCSTCCSCPCCGSCWSLTLFTAGAAVRQGVAPGGVARASSPRSPPRAADPAAIAARSAQPGRSRDVRRRRRSLTPAASAPP